MSDAAAPLEVLLVDDDPVVRKNYGNQIRLEGWNVALASDGFEALQAAQDRRFDLILLDVRTPYKSGAEVLRSLRSRPEAARAAVFLLAEPGDAEIVDRTMHEGADGVIEKARTSPREAISEIRTYLEQGGRATAQGPLTIPAVDLVSATGAGAGANASPDVVKRVRTATPRSDSEARAASNRKTTTVTRDLSAAARMVQARLAQRAIDDLDRGPAMPMRRTTSTGVPPRESTVERPLVEALEALEELEALEPDAPAAAPPPLPGAPTASYGIVLHRFVGESAKLAVALGLPPDLSCPICRQQLGLRLSPDPTTDAGVRGHFYCPRCTSA